MYCLGKEVGDPDNGEESHDEGGPSEAANVLPGIFSALFVGRVFERR